MLLNLDTVHAVLSKVLSIIRYEAKLFKLEHNMENTKVAAFNGIGPTTLRVVSIWTHILFGVAFVIPVHVPYCYPGVSKLSPDTIIFTHSFILIELVIPVLVLAQNCCCVQGPVLGSLPANLQHVAIDMIEIQ